MRHQVYLDKTVTVDREPGKMVLSYMTQGEWAVFRIHISADMKEVIFGDKNDRNSFKLTKEHMADLITELQQLHSKMED